MTDTTPRLPWDYCRCMGENCPVREDCLRYLARDDCGPRTPYANRLCRVENNDYDHQLLRGR